jgi:hypothetical protein
VLVPSGRSHLAVELRHRKLNRSVADPAGIQPQKVQTRVERTADGWRLELFFPPETLSGFDPEVNRRLGLYAIVTDPTRGDQPLGPGRDFPAGEDPSLWNTLELIDRKA